MILGRKKTAPYENRLARHSFSDDGLILASVPKFELVSCASHREPQNLITQANSKHGNFFGNDFFHISDGFLDLGRVSGTVGNNHSRKWKTNFGDIGVPRHDHHFQIPRYQTSYNIS